MTATQNNKEIRYWIDYQYATKNLYLLYKEDSKQRLTEKLAEFNNIDEALKALELVENLQTNN